MNEYNQEKVYFLPGDVVELRQLIPNKPKMIVVRKKTLTIRPKDGDKDNFLQGIICMWFTTTGDIVEHLFSTKDLQKVK